MRKKADRAPTLTWASQECIGYKEEHDKDI